MATSDMAIKSYGSNYGNFGAARFQHRFGDLSHGNRDFPHRYNNENGLNNYYKVEIYHIKMHSEEALVAQFEPTEAKLLTTVTNSNLLVESPILASALSNLFPYLLMIDNGLEIITWTNEDPFVNFLGLVLFTIITIYWSSLSLVVLPLVYTISFSCIVWTINSIIMDSKFDEKPTIDEVLSTLHNITIRVELLLRPVQHFPFTKKNYIRMYIMAILLTPLHVGLLKTILPINKFVLIVGLFTLSYHSPWCYSIRRLFWRSIYIRLLAFFITGINVKLDKAKQRPIFHSNSASGLSTPTTSDVEELNSVPILADFKIIKKVIISPTRLKQITKFEVLENQRRWFGLGWTNFLLPNERPSWCFEKSMQLAPAVITDNTDDDFPFPIFPNDLYYYHWNWVEPIWKLDKEFNKSKDERGWVYYDSKWQKPSFKDGFLKYTRSRRWTRKAELIIDKQHELNDGVN